MEALHIFLHAIILIAIAGLIVGLIDPTRIYCKSRKHVAIYFGIPLVLCLITKSIVEKAERHKQAQKYVEQVFKEIMEDPEKAYSEYYGKSSQTTEQTKPKNKEADFSCAVRDFSFRKSFGDNQYGLGSTADGIYLIIDISIKNLGDEPRRFPFNDFYVTDTNGVRYTFQDYTTSQYRSETSSLTDWDFEKLNGTRMFQPNVPTRDCILFEVPKSGEYFLHFAGRSAVVTLE